MPPSEGVAFWTLFSKEVLRFWRVALQTIAAPIVNALLYLLIFSYVLERHETGYGEVPYTAFLVPGLAMMSLLQNAFANSSSSLIQSRMTGNLVFLLVTPISHATFFLGYTLAAVVRGMAVGGAVLAITMPFVEVPWVAPCWSLGFALLAAWMMGALGVVAGIWSEKFDHLAAFQNFLVTPLTMLAGVFYSTASLPPVWEGITHANPFFYMIDGFRYGFFGKADVSPWVSLAVTVSTTGAVSFWAYHWIAVGYKLRS
ncbi:MAG: ABC transporter permease [Hydrogenophilus sp.]|nr:ABC transporter permease [Hydrogenophilus sp.]